MVTVEMTETLAIIMELVMRTITQWQLIYNDIACFVHVKGGGKKDKRVHSTVISKTPHLAFTRMLLLMTEYIK